MLMIDNIEKSYGEKELFKNLNLTITEDARIGLVGVNGTGKSTLLQVIAGLEKPDSGVIHYPKGYRIAYLKQNPDFDTDETILEYIFAGEAPKMKVMRAYEKVLSKLEKNPQSEQIQEKLLNVQQEMDKEEAWEANAQAKTILTKLGITQFEDKVNSLSGGQKKRVAIAKVCIQPVDLLILDEPTNHLDHAAIIWLEQYLSAYEGALLFVTHDRYFLNRVTNRMIELDLGTLYEYEGNYETFLAKKVERLEMERQEEAKHKNTLRQELAWLKRGARARSTKQKARIERIDDMKEKTFHTEQKQIAFQVGSSRLGKQVIELEAVEKSFEGHTLFQDFSLLIKPGDRIGIIGPNGTGKTTLMNIMAGRMNPDQGEVSIGETVKVAYYTQGEAEIDDNQRVIEYIKETAQDVITKDGDIITAEQMLEQFLFPRPKQWEKIGRLSGGEKRRLYLLKVLMTAPNVIMLDEPTNDLDIETLSILEEYLNTFPGVVITVSHDRYFLDVVTDELLIFGDMEEIEHFYGNYSAYLEREAAEKPITTREVAKESKSETPKTKKKLSYREQQEWNTIEDDIMTLEKQIDELKTEINEQGSDFEKVQKLYEEQQELEEALLEKMERWEELSLLVESFEK